MTLLFLANIWGWVVAHWRLLAYACVVAAFFVLILLTVRSCRSEPKLDQKEVIEAQRAIETGDREKMAEKLAEWDVEKRGIDNSVKAAEEATEKAKRDYSKLTNEQLAAEIERRLNER